MRLNVYQEDTAIWISLDSNYLTVELLTHTLFYDVQYIYAVNVIDSWLHVHTCKPPREQLTSDGSAESTQHQAEDSIDLWKRVTLSFKSTDDAAEKASFDAFVNQLRTVAHCETQNERSSTTIYAIINPTSGAQQAPQEWATTVNPMLSAAGFDNIQVVHTVANGTRMLVQTKVAQPVCASPTTSIVLILGGDGTVHDVVNGLADGCNVKKATLRIGILPLGSGNAFALSLGLASIEQATLRVIKGQTKQIRLMDVDFGQSPLPKSDATWIEHLHFPQQPRKRLLVVMSWGFHCQIVSKSHYLRRFMGNKRFSLVAMFLLWFLQQYEGELVLKNARAYDRQLHTFSKTTSTVRTTGPFTYFVATKQHSLERGFTITPHASPFSDDIDIVMLQNATAEDLKKASMLAFQGGKHVDDPQVNYYKVSEQLLRVRHSAELCLDGEIHEIPADGIVRLRLVESDDTEPSFDVFV